MAELPRYRPLGLAIPSVPTVDFTMAGQARARAGDAVAKGLDAMGDYIYKRQVAAAKREAAQWAYDNPITIEQLQAAKAGGISIDDIVGDPDTVFGAVSAATAAKQLTAKLEGSARQQLSKYAAEINAGKDVDIDTMQRDIVAMQTSHADLIAQLDPDLASKYSATVATLASPVYKSALERRMKLQQAADKNDVNDKMPAFEQAMGQIFSSDNGAVVPGTNILDSLATSDVLIDTIEQEAMGTNDADFVKATVDEARKIRQSAIRESLINSVFDDEFATTDIKRISRMRRGDFGEKSALYGSLSLEEQAAVRTGIRDRIEARQKDDKLKQDLLDDDKSVEFATVVQKFNDAPADTALESQLEDKMYDIARATNNRVTNPTAIQGILSSKRSAITSKSKPVSNAIGKGKLKLEIYEGKIQTTSQLVARATGLGVGANDYADLLPEIKKFQDEDYRRGVSETSRAAKIYFGSGQIPTQQQIDKQILYQRRMQKTYDDAMDEWTNNNMIGPKPSYEAIAQDITKMAQESRFQVSITNKFNSLKSTYPSLSAYFTEEQFPTLEALITDNDFLESLGLGARQIRELRANYTTDLQFIKDNIDKRDAL